MIECSEKGKFTSAPVSGGLTNGGEKSDDKTDGGLTNNADNDIIKSQISEGKISLIINHEKQSRHIKDSPLYKEGRSYLTISEEEAQIIVNEKSNTGILVFDKKGNWTHKELIACDMVIGTVVELITRNEIPTKCATIHYSKTGTHIVPRRE